MRMALTMLLGFPAGCILVDVTSPLTGASAGAWQEVGQVARPLKEINEAAFEILSRQGYTIANYNPREPHQETEWDIHLSNIWQEGYRTKVEVDSQSLGAGGYQVRVRSYREFNDNALRPMSLADARWSAAVQNDVHKGQVDEPALHLRMSLKVKFFGLGRD